MNERPFSIPSTRIDHISKNGYYLLYYYSGNKIESTIINKARAKIGEEIISLDLFGTDQRKEPWSAGATYIWNIDEAYIKISEEQLMNAKKNGMLLKITSKKGTVVRCSTRKYGKLLIWE